MDVAPEAPTIEAEEQAAGGIRRVFGNLEWLYTDYGHIADSMLPSSETRLRQEFELGDMMQAFARTSDLSVYLSAMPTLFWIFVIVLVYQFVNVATAIMEVWIDAVIYHYGQVALLLLFAVVATTWPVFIWYLVQTFSYTTEVMALHQRTVQVYEMPASLCTSQVMHHFCEERSLRYSSILLPPRLEERRAVCDRFTVEIVFPSIGDMQKALTSGGLTPQMKIDKHWVRLRPKVGCTAVTVEWWLVCFEYLCEAVPEKYWLRATLSCLITMSLTKHVTGGLVWAYLALESALGLAGLLLTKLFMMLSLISFFFFVGFHAFQDIVLAHREMLSDTRRDRVASEHLLTKAAGPVLASQGLAQAGA